MGYLLVHSSYTPRIPGYTASSTFAGAHDDLVAIQRLVGGRGRVDPVNTVGLADGVAFFEQ